MRRRFRFAKPWLPIVFALRTLAASQSEPHQHEAPGHEGMDMGNMAMPGMETGGGSAGGWYASGTSIVPRSTPIDMLHRQVGQWSVMYDAVAWAVYTNQTGPRGRDKFFSPNRAMLMASHKAGPGMLTIRGMFSLEAATITNRRYPLLFQTGETAHGIPIINGQHPHDLLMELAAAYQIRLGAQTVLNFYGGPRGEPALGPTAFPHRVSTSENPLAVLGHHEQDSTHISTNVVTAGITHRRITLEASAFHGREPDEKRWGIESGAIDSFAARLTVTPASRWSGQVSVGRINNREATHPLRDTLRSTASVMYVRPGARGRWATSVIWGRNNDLAYTAQPVAATSTTLAPRHIVTVPTRVPRQIYNSFLVESTVRWRDRNWAWGRAESVDKDSTLLYEEAPYVSLVDERRFARVQAYTGGYERELPVSTSWLSPAIGGQFTVFHVPASLSPVYGENPASAQLFVRVRVGQAKP